MQNVTCTKFYYFKSRENRKKIAFEADPEFFMQLAFKRKKCMLFHRFALTLTCSMAEYILLTRLLNSIV